MFESTCCRLCTKMGDAPLNLYDISGQENEAYLLTAKFFTRKLMNMEWGQPLKNICLECWSLLYEFNKFHETVMVAQGKLALSYIPPEPTMNNEGLKSMPTDKTFRNEWNSAALTNYVHELPAKGNVTTSYPDQGSGSTKSNIQKPLSKESQMNEAEVASIPARVIVTDVPPQINSSDIRILNVMSYSTLYGTPEILKTTGIQFSRPWERKTLKSEEVIRVPSATVVSHTHPQSNYPDIISPSTAAENQNSDPIESDSDNKFVIIPKSIKDLSPTGKQQLHSTLTEEKQTVEPLQKKNSHDIVDLAAFSPTKQSHSQSYVVSILEQNEASLQSSQTPTPTEASEDSSEELDVYDEPTGIFAGGKFGKPSSELSLAETGSLFDSDMSLGNLSSDNDDQQPAIHTLSSNKMAVENPTNENPNETPKKLHRDAEEFDVSEAEEFSGDKLNDSNAESDKENEAISKMLATLPRSIKEFDTFLAKWGHKLECVVCHKSRSCVALMLQHCSEKHPKEGATFRVARKSEPNLQKEHPATHEGRHYSPK